jgi:hypothetical protein
LKAQIGRIHEKYVILTQFDPHSRTYVNTYLPRGRQPIWRRAMRLVMGAGAAIGIWVLVAVEFLHHIPWH